MTIITGEPIDRSQMKPEKDQRGRIEGLQILRAIAALMVVVHHAGLTTPGSPEWLKVGDCGVDIFFVISGFVMAYTTWSVPGELELRQRLAAAGSFVAKRLLRIAPLYWLALFWTARRSLGESSTWRDLLKDFLFIPHGTPDHPDWIFPTLGQGWTLNYEMFFYVLVAASLLLPWRRNWILGLVLVGLVVAGLFTPFSDSGSHAKWFVWEGDPTDVRGLLMHVYSNNIVLEFLYGIALAAFVVTHPASAWPRWACLLLGLAGLAVLIAGHDFWPRGIFEGLPAAVIVACAVYGFAGLRLPFLALMGAASYALYLFHWTTFGLTKTIALHLGLTSAHAGGIATLIISDVVLATVLCVGIHLAIEKPFLRWATRGLRRSSRPVAAPPRASEP